MKVLWLCDYPLSDMDLGGTAAWQGVMARRIMDSGAVELGIISTGPVGQFTQCDYRQVKQWIIPATTPLGRDGLPPAALVQAIIRAANNFSPDLIHNWGTEVFWGLLSARGLLTYPSLLEIQGLKGRIAKVFSGDLKPPELLRSIGIKELLKRRTICTDRRVFARWGLREEEIIRGHMFVDVQSYWVASHIVAVNPDARLFPVDLPLRHSFYDADAWQYSGRPGLFCIANYPVPYKGLHVAVRALSLIKKRIPDARLRIAGAHQRPGIRQDGYMRWVNRMIRRLDLVSAVDWLGTLNAAQIVAELKNAAAAVLPTFMETYCMALAEAMSVGTPTVVSYTGGTAYLGKDEDSCLFFPPGDEAMCAYQLERVLIDQRLAERLSDKARAVALVRNNPYTIVKNQLEIYRQVIAGGADC